MRILTELAHEDGYCVIIVTHDEQLASITDRTIHLKDGLIIPTDYTDFTDNSLDSNAKTDENEYV